MNVTLHRADFAEALARLERPIEVSQTDTLQQQSEAVVVDVVRVIVCKRATTTLGNGNHGQTTVVNTTSYLVGKEEAQIEYPATQCFAMRTIITKSILKFRGKNHARVAADLNTPAMRDNVWGARGDGTPLKSPLWKRSPSAAADLRVSVGS